MSKNEKIFLGLAILFFIFGFTCVSLVSSSIAQFIGKHGWKLFNRIFLPFMAILACGIVGFVVSRLWIRFPTWKEGLVVLLGTVFTVSVLSRVVLLTTELIHLPQFAISTVLYCAAFPRHRWSAVGLSVMVCVADEWFQSFLPKRVLDLNDVFLNLIGLYIGLVLWWAIDVTLQSRRATSSDQRDAMSSVVISGNGLGT